MGMGVWQHLLLNLFRHALRLTFNLTLLALLLGLGVGVVRTFSRPHPYRTYSAAWA